MRARFSALLALTTSLVACGGSDSSNDLNSSSGTGTGGGGTGPSCTALLVCCAQIKDETSRKQCIDGETKNASASSGEAVCGQLLSVYQSTGLCGGGAGGGSGAGGTSSIGGASSVGGASSTGGTGGTSKGGAAGTGAGGSGTAGTSGVGGSGTAGTSGVGGSGTAGTSGVGGSGTAGTSGVGGSGTAGTSGVGGSGTAGSGTAGSGAAGAGGSGTGGATGNPVTCADAAASPSTIGCEFWPTVTANLVWSIFDYAVVVANPGTTSASVQVTRGGTSVASATVAPGALQTIYLPWVLELKGPDTDSMGAATALSASVGVLAGAYRLVSDRPVSVTQFNPIEVTGMGGPAGKSWTSCPGNGGIGCFSFSADASLLLPTSSLGTSYRVAGKAGWTFPGQTTGIGPTLSITAVANGTSVKVVLGPGGKILGGTAINATAGGGTLMLTMAAGDAVELVGDNKSDFSGTLITSNTPVQVISGIPCTNIPDDAAACDHVEETLMPTTTLGKKHVVAVPSAVGGKPISHSVRLVGHVDGTTLTYSGATPPGAPATLNAGQVADLGLVTGSFVVDSSSPIVVVSFLPGGSILDPAGASSSQKGDPSMTVVPPVEQLRASYLFLAPTDYDEAWADVTMPSGTIAQLDGVTIPTTTIDASWGVARVKLVGMSGAHQLKASAAVGLQVLGYAQYTSVEYPGGYSLTPISPP